jgi:hypothetical protein
MLSSVGSWERWIGRLEAVPLGARLGVAWMVCLLPRAVVTWRMGPISDYLRFADPTAESHAYLYPAYEALARLLWACSGGSVLLHVGQHVALHAAVGPLVYLCCARLKLSPGAAWLSVLGVALLPYYVSLAARQPQTGLVISFVATLLLVFLRWWDAAFSWRGGLTFAFLGFLSALLRPNLLVSVGLLYALALGYAGYRRATATGSFSPGAPGRILASGAVLGLLLVGLSAVSQLRTGYASPFPPVAGYNLYIGHNEHVGAYLRRYDILSLEDIWRDHGAPSEVLATHAPYERDRVLLRVGLDYAREHPGETLSNVLLKALRYWDVRLEDAEENPLLWNLGFTAPYLGYGCLAVLGIFWMLRERRGVALAILAVLLVSYWLPHLVFFPTIRMRMTTEFVLIVLAAHALDRLLATNGGPLRQR